MAGSGRSALMKSASMKRDAKKGLNMIQLEQIPVSDKLGNLRNRINAMVTEINTDQMVIGQVMNPSIVYINQSGDQVGASTASQVESDLYALCMPESNGVFIARLFGQLFCHEGTLTANPYGAQIDIPAIKLPNRDSVVSTFVTPEHLGFTPKAKNTIGMVLDRVSFHVTSGDYTFTATAKFCSLMVTENHAELIISSDPS